MTKPSTVKKTSSLSVIENDGADAARDKSFHIRIRSLRTASHVAITVARTTPEAAAIAALGHDTSKMDEPVFVWDGKEKQKLVAIDIDRPDDAPRLDEAVPPTLFPAWLPQPVASWVTHGGGLRALFTSADDESALALAGAWYLCAPLGEISAFTVEVKTDTRHPAGMRGNERCGRVYRFTPTASFEFPTDPREVTLDTPDANGWLLEHGLTFGRNEQGACPWCGERRSDCNACVVVNDKGIRCFRCQKYEPWGKLLDTRPAISELKNAARQLVHFQHQRLVLRDARSNIPEVLLKPTWEFMLRLANQDRLTTDTEDCWRKRVARAASGSLDIVRGADGQWLSADTLKPRKVSADRTLKELPWALTKAQIDKALSTELLEGFVPVEPVPRSLVLAPSLPAPLGIRVRRPPEQQEPPAVDLGTGMPSPRRINEAWAAIDAALPGLQHGYLSALVLATLKAQYAVGTPPIIVVTGPTGSAKTATTHLAAGMVGAAVGDVTLRVSAGVIGTHFHRSGGDPGPGGRWVTGIRPA